MTRARRPAGSRNHPVKSDIEAAFEDGKSDVEGLKEEISEWADSLESNNMEHLPKYEEVSAARDALESSLDALEGINFPECLSGVEVNYTTDTRQSAQSRSGRMGNALCALSAAKDGAEAWLEQNPELGLEEPDEEDGALVSREPITKDDIDERETARTEVEEFVNDLDNAISEAEGVDFPGMY